MSSDSDAVDTEILSDFGMDLESGGEGELEAAHGGDPPNQAENEGEESEVEEEEEGEEGEGGGNPGRGGRAVGMRRLARAMRAGGGGNRPNRQVVLRDFLRLIAGNRMHLGENAADNVELVNILKDLHVVRR